MVGQVKVIGILMLVHGITVVIMGGILVAVGIMMFVVPQGPGGPEPWMFGALYSAWGVMILVCGVLNVVAGIRIISFKNRVLGLVALFSNILILFSCYCAITAIGMMVYGLIVLFNSDVSRAFELVSRGATPDEAIRKFTRRYDDARDDYDEMSDSRRKWEDDRRRRRTGDDDLHLELDEDEPR